MYAATLSSATAHAVPAPCGRALPSRAPQPQPPPGRRRQLQRASVLRCQASPPTPPAKLSPRERKLAQKKALRQQERAGRQADAVVVNQEEQPPGPASGPEPTRPQERNAPQPATVEPPRAQQQRDGGAAATTSAPAPPPPASRPAAASKTPPPPHPATAAGSRRGDSSGAPAPAPQAAAAAAAPAQLLSQLMALAEEKLGVRDCAASASAAAADSVDAVARAVVAQAQAGALSEQQVSDAAWALLALGHPLARAAQDALGVPFEVLPGALSDLNLTVEAVKAEVPLRQETVLMADGRTVPEARLTAWLSDAGADFRYSGKVMLPEPGGLSPLLAAVRDRLEERTGVRYDSVLVNLYPDGKSGMRFHSDPLYEEWSADSSVVSIGCARTLVFRDVSDFNRRISFTVRSGDVTRMHDDCQERFQHSIKVEREAADATERVSLVYKKRLDGR